MFKLIENLLKTNPNKTATKSLAKTVPYIKNTFIAIITKGMNILLISKGIKRIWLDCPLLVKQLIERSKKKIGQIENISNLIQVIFVNENNVVRLDIKKALKSNPKKKWEDPIFLSD